MQVYCGQFETWWFAVSLLLIMCWAVWSQETLGDPQTICQGHIGRLLKSIEHKLFGNLTFKDEAQTALFKDPVRTAL